MMKLFAPPPRSLRILSCTVIAIVALFIFGSPAALAHRPHDVISQIEISPDFDTDKTVYTIVRNNLYKSTDGGENWVREIEGLDYEGELGTLTLSASDKNTLYIATRSDGVYKSEDAGESWRRVNRGIDTLHIDIVEAAPSSSDVVVATGIDDKIPLPNEIPKGKGLYLSEDGGKSWKNVFKTPAWVTAIAFSPTNPNRIIFADNGGELHLTADAGKTWKNIPLPAGTDRVTTLAFSPNAEIDNTLYIGTGGGKIYKSVNTGESFEEIGRGIPETARAIEDIIVSPNYASDSAIYASTWHDGLYISRDGGKTWTKFDTGLTRDHQADDFKTPHFTDLEVNKDTMFLAGFNGLFTSADGGQNWRELNTLLKGTVISLAVSPNYANDSTVAVATYVGNIFISRDKGETWTPINRGLEKYNLVADKEEVDQDPRRFFDIAFSPDFGKDRTIFASLLWTNLLKTENAGESWRMISLGDTVRGLTIVPSPDFASDRTVYITNQFGKIYRSTDGGNSFRYINDIGQIPGNSAPSMVISPDYSNDKTLFGAGRGGIFRYTVTSSGGSWKNTTERTPLETAPFLQLAISPDYRNDGTVFTASVDGLYVTRDRGETWKKIQNTPFPSDSLIDAVAVSPNYANDKTVLISIQGLGLFKSTDGGETFTATGDPGIAIAKTDRLPSAGIPIEFSPNYANDRTIFGFGGAKTDVYRSIDGGRTWQTFRIPLNIEENKTRYKIGEFFSGPWGRIWRFLIPAIAAIVTYFLARFFKLGKKFKLNPWVLGILPAFIVFILAFGLIAQF
jgi:photosystem II stability/assembly factor-like uncharacterized protein